MATTSDRLGKQVKKVTKKLRKKAGNSKDTTQEMLEQMRGNVTEYFEQGRDKVQSVACGIEHYVQERPVKTVLIAAGVGMLFGRFWMRR